MASDFRRLPASWLLAAVGLGIVTLEWRRFTYRDRGRAADHRARRRQAHDPGRAARPHPRRRAPGAVAPPRARPRPRRRRGRGRRQQRRGALARGGLGGRRASGCGASCSPARVPGWRTRRRRRPRGRSTARARGCSSRAGSRAGATSSPRSRSSACIANFADDLPGSFVEDLLGSAADEAPTDVLGISLLVVVAIASRTDAGGSGVAPRRLGLRARRRRRAPRRAPGAADQARGRHRPSARARARPAGLAAPARIRPRRHPCRRRRDRRREDGQSRARAGDPRSDAAAELVRALDPHARPDAPLERHPPAARTRRITRAIVGPGCSGARRARPRLALAGGGAVRARPRGGSARPRPLPPARPPLRRSAARRSAKGRSRGRGRRSIPPRSSPTPSSARRSRPARASAR